MEASCCGLFEQWFFLSNPYDNNDQLLDRRESDVVWNLLKRLGGILRGADSEGS